jgi:hypothetical protein
MGYHEHIWFHQCQEDINSLFHFERIPENILGAYVSLESELMRYKRGEQQSCLREENNNHA